MSLTSTNYSRSSLPSLPSPAKWAGHDIDHRWSREIGDMTPNPTETNYTDGTFAHCWRDEIRRMAVAWGFIDGSLSARCLGSISSADCASATNAEPISIKPS